MASRMMRELSEGAAAGTVATMTMSAAMFAAKHAGLMGEMPPEKITAKAFQKLGVRLSEKQQVVTASAAHVVFGAGAGVLFRSAVRRVGRSRLIPPLGLIFGTAVWGFSYTVPVPALGLMPAPHRDRRGRPTSMLVAHWVYGATLGLLIWKLVPRGARLGGSMRS